MSTATSDRPVIPWYTFSVKERSRRIHARYVNEGTMVAFPLCLPGASLPIIHDESAITALATPGDGMIYGGTSGHATHLFSAIMHGTGGGVLDLGVVEGANECAALVFGSEKIAACVNGPAGGRVVIRDRQEMASDMIQEWDFAIEPLRDLGQPVPGERLLHAVADASGRWLVGVSQTQLFRVDLVAERCEVIAPLASLARIAADPHGNVYGIESASASAPASLWRYAVAANQLARQAVPLPQGEWDNFRPFWTRQPVSGVLYFSDAAARIFALRGDSVEFIAQTPQQPILTMAAIADDRIFGMCGGGITRLFGLDLATREVKPLASVASVIQQKRYGYEFADAILGRDGQIIFGENDNNAHLWLYFPSVKGHPVEG